MASRRPVNVHHCLDQQHPKLSLGMGRDEGVGCFMPSGTVVGDVGGGRHHVRKLLVGTGWDCTDRSEQYLLVWFIW